MADWLPWQCGHLQLSIRVYYQLVSMHAGMQVSAGYDAHWRDPLAGLQMRSSTYYRLAARIKALADSLSGRGLRACPGKYHTWVAEGMASACDYCLPSLSPSSPLRKSCIQVCSCGYSQAHDHILFPLIEH